MHHVRLTRAGRRRRRRIIPQLRHKLKAHLRNRGDQALPLHWVLELLLSIAVDILGQAPTDHRYLAQIRDGVVDL